MATSIASPAAASTGFDGGGGSDIFAELGETLRSAIPEESGDEPGEIDVTTEGDQQSPADTPDSDSGEPQQQAADTNEPFPVTEDGKSYVVPKEQLAEIGGLREYSTAVQEWFPTTADAKMAFESSTDFRSMQLDYESGEPQSIDRALNFWTGANASDPYTRQRFQESFSVMAQRMPEVLAKINPQAHQQLSAALAKPFIEQAYLEAAKEADPERQKQMLRNAQATDYAITKSYRNELPKYDPRAQELQANQQAEQRRQQEFEQREQRMLERDFTAFNQSSIDGAKIDGVWAEIDKILAPIKGKYDASEYDGIRNAVMGELTQKLKTGANAEWFNTHVQEHSSLKRMFQQAWKNGQDPKSVLGQRAQYYINDLLVRARRVLPSIAAPRISKAESRKAGVPVIPKNATARPQTQKQPLAAAPEKNGHEYYNVKDDPEFQRMFR